MEGTERIHVCEDFLRSEGYELQTDSHCDIIFKEEGKTYVIPAVNDDEAFFCIVLPAFWKVESDDERVKAMNAALSATTDAKVAKVYLVQGVVCASVELFCSSPESFKVVFNRSLGALKTAVDIFIENMKGQ